MGFIRSLKKMSITKRLAFYFLLLLAVQIGIVGTVNYAWVSAYLEEILIKKMMEVNKSMVQEINFIRLNKEMISDKLLTNETIQTALQTRYDSEALFQKQWDKNTVERILSEHGNVANSVIIGKNDMLYLYRIGDYTPSSRDQIMLSEIYVKSLSSKGNNIWIGSGEDVTGMNNGPFLYVCRTIRAIGQGYKDLGQLILQMNLDSLEPVFSRTKPEDGEYYAVISSNGCYLYHSSNRSFIGSDIGDSLRFVLSSGADGYKVMKESNDEVIVSYSLYAPDGWHIIHVLPTDVIVKYAERVKNIIQLCMFLLLLISLPLLVTLSRTISKPIKTLKDTVEMFGKGQLAVRSNISRADEIGHLQVSFNKMADDINNLLARITEENKQRRILELDMLEYQINPHFLYNSLDSINWMARKAGNEDIGEMAMALSRFFRVGLSKGKEYYTVADELEHVRQYLLINKIRYKDCFTYDIQADPEVLSYTTIKIMLQPIVENAIKYGVDKSGTGGCIVVSVKKDGEKLCFTVADNGCGIPRDKLTDIQKALADKVLPDDDSENGFGLYHVNQRIWLHYGNGYGITLHCAQMEGLIVRVCIPLIRIPEINP